ncbi:hypothetical protein AA18890_1590 [Komagataeibacter europaeus LMG 18890]|nr:hypothetical protein AA18890_1590 [Komagataeibacter europaeus LMG 18890]
MPAIARMHVALQGKQVEQGIIFSRSFRMRLYIGQEKRIAHAGHATGTEIKPPPSRHPDHVERQRIAQPGQGGGSGTIIAKGLYVTEPVCQYIDLPRERTPGIKIVQYLARGRMFKVPVGRTSGGFTHD